LTSVKGINHIKNVFSWFQKTLFVIFPDTKAGYLETRIKHEIIDINNFSKILNGFDTGIDAIELKEIPFESISFQMKLKIK